MYFEANDLDQLQSNGLDSHPDLEYINLVIHQLDQSYVISSPFGKLVSYIKAFLDKYVELRN